MFFILHERILLGGIWLSMALHFILACLISSLSSVFDFSKCLVSWRIISKYEAVKDFYDILIGIILHIYNNNRSCIFCEREKRESAHQETMYYRPSGSLYVWSAICSWYFEDVPFVCSLEHCVLDLFHSPENMQRTSGKPVTSRWCANDKAVARTDNMSPLTVCTSVFVSVGGSDLLPLLSRSDGLRWKERALLFSDISALLLSSFVQWDVSNCSCET